MTQPTCTYPNCQRKLESSGLCNGHAQQRRRGAPLTDLQRRSYGSVQERLDLHTDKSGDCWEWTGSTNGRGYGQLRIKGRMHYAHRIAYEVASGQPLAPGLVVDHLCFNHGCVRPDHLHVVSQKQNQENRSGARKGNSSGVRGVTWSPRLGAWRARVTHQRRSIEIGVFDTADDAERAVISARNELFTNNQLDRLGAGQEESDA